MTTQKTSKVCIYVMTGDSGLAPNPFHGTCTLAICTPNHMRANLNQGDLIVGIAGVNLGKKLKQPDDQRRLVYAMKIDKRMTMNDYYNDAEYKLKIPKKSGSKIEMCGDNFYREKNEQQNEEIIHTRETEEHQGKKIEEQDCRGNRVFIGKNFYYFGSCALKIPQASKWGEILLRQVENKSKGISYIYGRAIKSPWTACHLEDFMNYLNANKIDPIPDPIDFDNWKSAPALRSSCAISA